jgi:hypothetical protein
MGTYPFLAVSQDHALRFFFEHLRDLNEHQASDRELLYNASVLAHFATTSAASTEFPATPSTLESVFRLFVMDQSQHTDPAIMEAAASQCLLLTGFFGAQLRVRHNVDWYASLGAGFYVRAAEHTRDNARADMMRTMAVRFAFWRHQQARLAQDLHGRALLLKLKAPGR